MIRITKDLNAEVVETGDPERTEENLHKSHENYSKYSYEPVVPVNGCHPRPAAGAVCLLQGFDRGPDCTASPVRDE